METRTVNNWNMWETTMTRLSSTKLGHNLTSFADAVSHKQNLARIKSCFNSMTELEQIYCIKKIILRCSKDQIQALFSLLEPLAHRQFQMVLRDQYPPHVFKIRLDVKRLQRMLHAFVDAIGVLNDLAIDPANPKNKRKFKTMRRLKTFQTKEKSKLLRIAFLRELVTPSAGYYEYLRNDKIQHQIQESMANLINEGGFHVSAPVRHRDVDQSLENSFEKIDRIVQEVETSSNTDTTTTLSRKSSFTSLTSSKKPRTRRRSSSRSPSRTPRSFRATPTLKLNAATPAESTEVATAPIEYLVYVPSDAYLQSGSLDAPAASPLRRVESGKVTHSNTKLSTSPGRAHLTLYGSSADEYRSTVRFVPPYNIRPTEEVMLALEEMSDDPRGIQFITNHKTGPIRAIRSSAGLLVMSEASPKLSLSSYNPTNDDHFLIAEQFGHELQKCLKDLKPTKYMDENLSEVVAESLLACQLKLADLVTEARATDDKAKMFNLKHHLSAGLVGRLAQQYNLEVLCGPDQCIGTLESKERERLQNPPPFSIYENCLPKISDECATDNYFSSAKTKSIPLEIKHFMRMKSVAALGNVKPLQQIQSLKNPKKAVIRGKKKSRTNKKEPAKSDSVYTDPRDESNITGVDFDNFELAIDSKEINPPTPKQFCMMSKETALWKPHLLNLLIIELIKLCTSQTVMHHTRYIISTRYLTVENILEIPDRVILMVFKILPASDIVSCQQVCSRWNYIGSLEELWITKLRHLGERNRYPWLAYEVLKDHSDSAIDWQEAYFTIEKIYRSGSPEPSNKLLHPATEARLNGQSVYELPHSEEKESKYRLSHFPIVAAKGFISVISSSSLTDDEHGGSMATQLRLIFLSGENPFDHMINLLNPINRKLDVKGRIELPKLTRFPRLKLSSSANTLSTHESDTYTPLTESSEEKTINVKPTFSKIVRQKLSSSMSGLNVTPHAVLKGMVMKVIGDGNENESKRTMRKNLQAKEVLITDLERIRAALNGLTIEDGQIMEAEDVGQVKPDLYDTARRRIALQETLGKIALDVRTDLQPAPHLDDKTTAVPKDIQERIRFSFATIPETDEIVGNENRHYSVPKRHGSTAAVIAPLQWVDLDNYNPKDLHQKKRFMGVVRPVTLVRKFKGISDTILSCAFDKKRLFTGLSNGYIVLWDLRTGTYVREMNRHNGSVRSLQLDSYNDLLYSASWDTSIIVWDLIKLQPKIAMTGHTGAVVAIRLSKDNRILVSASYDSTVRVWLTKTYNSIMTVKCHTDNLLCLWFDGRQVCVGSEDTTASLFVMNTNEWKHGRIVKYRTEPCRKDLEFVAEHAKGTGQEWNAAIRKKFYANRITAIHVMNQLVIGGTCHGELYCWERRNASTIAIFDAHAGSIFNIHFWCNKLLTSGSDGVIKEWEMSTMTCVRTLNDHNDAINDLEIDESQQVLISVGEDKLVHIWHFDPKRAEKQTAKEQTIKALVQERDSLEMAEQFVKTANKPNRTDRIGQQLRFNN